MGQHISELINICKYNNNIHPQKLYFTKTFVLLCIRNDYSKRKFLHMWQHLYKNYIRFGTNSPESKTAALHLNSTATVHHRKWRCSGPSRANEASTGLTVALFCIKVGDKPQICLLCSSFFTLVQSFSSRHFMTSPTIFIT